MQDFVNLRSSTSTHVESNIVVVVAPNGEDRLGQLTSPITQRASGWSLRDSIDVPSTRNTDRGIIFASDSLVSFPQPTPWSAAVGRPRRRRRSTRRVARHGFCKGQKIGCSRPSDVSSKRSEHRTPASIPSPSPSRSDSADDAAESVRNLDRRPGRLSPFVWQGRAGRT